LAAPEASALNIGFDNRSAGADTDVASMPPGQQQSGLNVRRQAHGLAGHGDDVASTAFETLSQLFA
jgi:hypothetical protein